MHGMIVKMREIDAKLCTKLNIDINCQKFYEFIKKT